LRQKSARLLLAVEPAHRRLQKVIVVSARRLLQERVDFLLGKPGLLSSALTETKNHEGIPILTSQLHGYVGIFWVHSTRSNSSQPSYSEGSFHVYYQHNSWYPVRLPDDQSSRIPHARA